MQARKFCVMLMVLATVLCGAWGRTYRWVGTTSEDSPGNWKSYVNSWEAAKSSNGTITEWTDPNDFGSSGVGLYHSYPDDGNSNQDTAYIDASSGDVYISISDNTTCSYVYVEGNNTVHFIVSPGKTFTIHNLIIGHNTSYSSNASGDTYANDQDSKLQKSVNIQISGGGTLNSDTTKYVNNSTESSISIEENSTFVTGAMNVTGTGNIQITGDGTGTYTSTFTDTKTLIDAENLTAGSTATGGTVVVTTSTYYWTGNANDGNKWTTSANWAPYEDGSGLVTPGTYPGHADNEKAVFKATVFETTSTVEVENFTVATEGNSVTIESAGTVDIKTATLNKAALTVKGGIVCSCGGTLGSLDVESGSVKIAKPLDVSGNVTVAEGTSIWGGRSFTIDGNAEINGALTNNLTLTITGKTTVGANGKIDTNTQNYNGNVENNGTIEAKGALTVASEKKFENNGTFIGGTGASTFNGNYIDSGSTSLSSGTITFGSGSTSSIKELTITDTGTIKNLSTNNAVTVGKTTLPTTKKNVRFYGDFKFTNDFTASADRTFFLDGNVDFSGCTNFSASDEGTFLFYNLDSNSSAKKITTKADMAFCNFYFGGNVDVVLNGDVRVSAKCEMSEIEENLPSDLNLPSDFTASLTTGNSAPGKLFANANGTDAASIQLVSKGKLIINADVECAVNLVHKPGISVTVNTGKTLTIKKDYRGYGGASDPDNEINIYGTISTVAAFGAGKAPTDGPVGNNAVVNIMTGGTLTVGSNIGYASTITNDGTLTVSDSIKEVNTLINQTGSVTVTDSISDMSSLENSENATKFEAKSITAASVSNKGTIKTKNLTVTSSIDSSSSNTTSLIEFIDDGTLSITSSANPNTLTNIQIDAGKTLTLKNAVVISGKVTFEDGSKLDAADYGLTLKGTNSSLSSITGTGTIVVLASNFSGEYLSIGENVKIKDSSSGVVKNGAYKAYSSVPAILSSPDEQVAYAILFKNGWDLGYDFLFTWTGSTGTNSTAWSTATNWDLVLVPGLTDQNTSGARVLIPDGCTSYPRIYSAKIKVTELTVGTATNSTHDARVILSTDSSTGYLQIVNPASGSGTLENYGTIEYKDSSRITDGAVTPSPINDVTNGGTVEYSGSAQTVTDFSSSGEDYANLVISGTNIVTAADIVVGGNLTVESGGSITTNNNSTVSGDLLINSTGSIKIKNNLTSKGKFVVAVGGSFEAVSSTTIVPSVIFAGTSGMQELSIGSGSLTKFSNVKILSATSVQSVGSYTVIGNWTNENSIDSGTGGFSAISGTITFTNSNLTITGKNNFNNLIFADGAGGTVTDKISVTGTTLIANGTGNELSLTGANSFTGLVTIGDSSVSPEITGGKIVLNSDENLQLGQVKCDSLEVQSSVKCTSDVASPATFTGSGAQINGNGKTFSKAVTFSGPSATLNGDNIFSGTVTFSGDGTTLSGNNIFNSNVTFTASTSIAGNNTFKGNVTCRTGGVTLTFADGSIQTIAPSSPTAKLVLNGNETSLLTLSGNAKIVVPKNTSSRTYFEGEYLSIPSNLVITSDASSLQVDYGAYSVQNSVPSEPSSPDEQDAYITLFKNGWDLGYAFSYVWNGDTDSSWSEKSNWNIGIVPGIQSSGVISGMSGKTTGAKVSIPDGLSNYPEVDVTGGVSVQSLEIGSSGGNPHNSSIKLTSNPVSVTQTDAGGRPLLTNFGTIEYTGAARITNGATTPLPINDVANNGTVLYSGGTQALPLEISTSASSGAAEADYANLVIKGIVSNPSPVTVSGTTLIELAPTAEISLVSANTFSGPVTIKSGNSIALIGANIFSGGVIVDAADSSVSLSCDQNFNLGNSATITKCKDLTLSSPAGILISAQNEINLSDKLTLSKNITLSLGAKNLTFASYSCAVDKSDTIEATSGGSITQTGATSSTIGKLNLTSGSSPYSLNGGTGGLVINSADYGSSSITTSENVTLAGTTSPDGIDVLKISAGKTILSGDNFVSSVEIDSGAVLQTGTASASTVHLSVNGDWTNNAGESGFVANSGTVEFTSSATISGNNSFNKAVFDENMSFGGSNSFSEFVCESAGKSLTFAPDRNQTVTKLTIRGTETGKINLTGIGEWQITPLDHAQISIAHAIITNSKNTDSEPIIVYAKNGYNTDGTGNTNWIFAGHKYIWNGAASTDWDTTSNWSPASVPREYADVEIPGGKTNYPKLTQDLNLKNDEKIFVVDTNGDGINENESVASSVAIDSGAVFDFAGNNLTVNALSSEGRIRVLGTESIAAAGDFGIKNLPLDSSSVLTGVIEYYGDFASRVSPNFGDKFSLLEFTAGSSGQISGAISVSGETLISNGAGKSLELTGDNTFAGDVKISGAGNVTIKGQKSDTSPLSLTGAVDSSKLNIKSDVVLNGNVTTTDTQDYEGKVILNAGIVFNAADSRLSFGSDILSGNENSALTFESPASLGGNVTTALSQTYKKNLTLLADVIFTAGAGVKFDSASELSITSDKSAKFKSPLSANCDLAITVPLFDFDSNASFKHTDSTKALTLKSGTALTFKNVAFDAGKLIIDDGASFTQTGVNLATAVQKVSAIENNGSCVWDSGSEGGSLLLAGSISGSKADQIIFNKKNVSLSATPITISGVFFDLTVPGGINATNGSGLVVRRNFTVSGSYLHNSQSLTLGSVTFDDGRKYASANNDDGSAGLISSPSNLGSVKIVQEGSGKKFTSNIEGLSFSLDDASVAAGSIEFAEKLKALSLTNAENTNFAILFDSACEITEAVTFGTSGNVILGTKEDSACLFANTLEHTAGDTKLAGSLQSSSAKFARTLLTQNVKIDCGSNSVIFTGDLDSDSSDSPRALSIGNESSLTSVKFEKTCGLVNPLASLLVYGNAEFGGNLISEGIVNLKGNVISFADVSLLSKKNYILLDGQNSRTVGAASGSLTFASDLFVDMDTEASLTLSSDITWQKIFCGYSGKITSGAVKLSGKDLILFGPAYSPDDPRYSGSDSRFAYFGYDSLAYKPASASLGFKSEFLTSGSQVILSGNFYANGLDLSGASFVIPNQAASNPLFNSSGDVTERQWGLPYAVAFNSEISNCSASSPEGSAFVTAAKAQNVTDKSGNTGFQFELPQISGAHSVSDSVICLTFDMALENSKGEVSSTIALVSSLEKGGIFYNGKSLAFDGKFYTESDGTDCSIPLSESSLALTDIPAFTPLYLKVSSAANNWNTDATASSAGSEDSTDRSGIHRNRTTDLSLFEGLFFAADGKTMCRNYGIGQWSENYADYSDAPIFATVDRARPVLVDLFTGQELHSTNTGTADSQKFYDSHNFIELRYSEPVDIGNLLAGAGEQNQNQQAQTEFNSAEKHGGAITNNSGSGGLTLAGFVSIEKGELTSGYKSGSAGSYSFNSDTNKAHALYRKFSKNAGDEEQIFPSRVRISVAGYVDEENPLSLDGAEFHNWIGYIDSSTSPAGQVIPLANKFITDLAVDSEGQPVKNIFDENNSSRSLSVNDRASSSSSSLYGDWDCSHPVFAAYVTNFNDSDPNVSWNYGDSDYRQYEMLGTVNSNTNAYIDTIEMHLFDNTQNYSADDLYKWAARKGWSSSGSSVIPGFEAPESAGGSRAIPQSAAMTHGGIRRSSLDGAISAFTYKYSLDDFESDFRPFAERDISQHVKSPIFRGETLSETFTDNDQPYLGLTINTNDSKLPIRTTFTVTYEPKKSFITDLAGNRLLHTDSGSDKKILHTIDITPPSFTMTISPVGENKIYAVFTKPLAYKGTYLSELGGELPSVLEKIASNLEFVYSEEDNVDTTSAPDGDKAISILSAELAVGNMDYTAILFTLDRKISLDDVEKIWIRINDLGEGTATLFGDVTASYIQDKLGNPVPVHTCHALSDFAINAVNMLYAYSDNTDDDGWDEHEIYGQGLAPESSDYAVHDFSEDGENYNRLRSGRDIVFQFEFFDSEDDKGKSALKNGEALALVYDEKANIRPEWKGSKYNLLTEGDWRIWLDNPFEAFSLSYNPSPLSASLPSPPIFADVESSDILKNMIWKNEDFNIEAGKEYQFFFKILDSSGNVIQINHDGDTRTPRIPLYTFRMPKERIAAGDFSYLDLWSFTTRDLTRQRGGVTILNNVINAALGEKTAIEVNMKNDGNLNVFVMTLDGNIIKRLSKGSVKAGTHYFYWDGKNGAGKPVARGLYFIRVSGNGIDETRKVMVVK